MSLQRHENLISIIVPIYNVEKYLKKCIDSIVCQTYKNIEIILINDGSKDSSGEICKEYKKDVRVKIINKENGGLSSARNEGLRCAKGNYIVCVDSDDWIEKDMVERLYINMNKYNADMSVCDYYTENYKKKSKKKFDHSIEILDNEKAMKYAILPKKFYGFAWNKMYKKNIMRDLLYNEKIFKGEDSPFSCEYISRCKIIVYENSPLYHYRQDTVSITRSSFSLKKMTVLYSYMSIIEMLKNKKYCEQIINMQKTQYANQLLSLMINIVETDCKKYNCEVYKIKKEMKKYKHNYIFSTDIDLLHKITYLFGEKSTALLKLVCKFR